MTTWLVKKDGRMFGPFDVDQVRRLFESGKIDEDTLVREGERGAWELISRVRGLLNDDETTSVADPFVPQMLRPADTEPSETTGRLETTGRPETMGRPESVKDGSQNRIGESDEPTASPSLSDVPPVESVESPVAMNPRAWKSTAPCERPSVAVPSGSSARSVSPPAVANRKSSFNQIHDSRSEPDGVVGETNPIVAGLLSCVPGAGHLYLGMTQAGFTLMAAIPTLYVFLWGGCVILARACINADGAAVTDQSFAGRLVAEQTGSSVGISVLATIVIVCLIVPMAAHVASAVHAVQNAD